MAGTVATIAVAVSAGSSTGEDPGSAAAEAAGEGLSSPDVAGPGIRARDGAGTECRASGCTAASDALWAPPQEAARVAAATMAKHPLTRGMVLGFEDMDLRSRRNRFMEFGVTRATLSATCMPRCNDLQ